MGIFGELAQSIDSVSSDVRGLFGGTGPKTSNQKYSQALASELLRYDVGRSTYFDVQITEKPGTVAKSGDSKSLTYLCHTAELPGEATATVTQKHYGVTEKFSVMTGYNDITLAFYTRGSGVEISRKYFQDWLAFMTGRFETVNYKGKQTVETTYNVQYKDYYTSTIKITHYAITGDPLVEVTLYDAFPVSINQVPLSWSTQNQAQSLNVTFA